ncbi:MAG: InlB B-repeat-containing protein, partial [Oscillospiraceae bacterium]|nr:InlB B-repeat-containing protein [Oscillospiraceae bacterium]
MKTQRKYGKLLGVLFAAALLILCSFSKISAQETISEGEIMFTLTPNTTATAYAFTDVAVGATAVGYSAVNMSFPSEIQMNYNGAVLSSSNIPANWTVTTSGTEGTTNVSIMIAEPAVYGLSASIENFFSSSTLSLKTIGVYPLAGSVVTIMISEQSIVQFTDASGAVHIYEFVEFAKQNDKSALTWLQAYNAARARSFFGQRGYLATLTTIEEQMFVYNTIAQKPGWLGGTTLRHNSPGNPMIDGQADISTNIGDYTYSRNVANVWYWADGPEAGMVFYNRPTQDDANGPVPGVFNFFSNRWTYNTYPQYQNKIQNGKEPNGDGGEYCLQFAWSNKASWNDLSNNNISAVQGYYVEYDFPHGISSSSGIATAEIPVPFTVLFNVGNTFYFETIANQTVWGGGTAAQPSTFEVGFLYRNYGNMLFLGWFENLSDAIPFDFSTPLTALNTHSNIKVLSGKWEQCYTVTFAGTNGHDVPAQSVVAGGTAIEPDTSSWSTAVFSFYGWSLSSTDDYSSFTEFSFDFPINADIVIYGVWDPIIYSLIFNPNGGSWDGDVTPRLHEYCPGADNPPWDDYDPSHIPEAPSRLGYGFDGWMDGGGMPPAATTNAITANSTYYAQWQKDTESEGEPPIPPPAPTLPEPPSPKPPPTAPLPPELPPVEPVPPEPPP